MKHPLFEHGSAPSLRVVAEILDHVDTFFTEAGCPLTDAQVIVLDEARDHVNRGGAS